MTTIAYRAGIMAADTCVTDRCCRVGTIAKIWRRDDGALAGMSGAADDMAVFRKWFLDGADAPYPAIIHDSEGILVLPGGQVLGYFKSGIGIEIEADFFAIGSGFKAALGAMHAGADAAEAVRIAALLDVDTALPLTIIRLGEPA